MTTIDTPTQWQAQPITDQWTLLPSWLPVPGMGDVSRVHLLEPGDVYEAGGHRLVSSRPPYYDAPGSLSLEQIAAAAGHSCAAWYSQLEEDEHEFRQTTDRT
jgi:hypothetical protein